MKNTNDAKLWFDKMKKTIRVHGLFLSILILPILLFHEKIVWQGWIICGGDMINQFVPWRQFALQELSEGRMPWWNPHVFCGAPLAANIQTSLFYPTNVLNLFFSVERTFSLSLVFHHILAALTMYLFLLKLFSNKPAACLGAVLYAWSGFFITHAHDGHLIHVRAYALLPLALYFQTFFRQQFDLRIFFLFALSLAGMFYAGHTQIPLYVFYLLIFRACWWGGESYLKSRKWGEALRFPLRTCAGIGIALALSAAVLLPLYELSTKTAGRAGGADYEFATGDSMPPQHLLTFVAPYFYGNPVAEAKESRFWETQTGYHEICGYIGILPLLLFCFAFIRTEHRKQADDCIHRETLFFALVAVGGLFFALGRYNPLYPLLYYGLPGWSFFRVPGRLVLIFIIGMSVCCAFGLQNWANINIQRIKNSAGLKIAAIGSLLFFFLVLSLIISKSAILSYLREIEIERSLAALNYSVERRAVSQQLPDILFEIRYSWMLGSSLLGLIFLIASWCALWTMLKLRSSYRWAFPLLLLLADLIVFSYRFFPTQSPEAWREEYFPQTSLVSFLQENAKGNRVVCLDDAIGHPGLQYHPELRPNRLMMYGIESARGYDPIILDSYSRYINRIYNRPPETPQGGLLFFAPPLEARTQKGFNEMNVKYVVTTTFLPKPFQLAWKEENSPLKIYENPNVHPRFYGESGEQISNMEIIQQHPTNVVVSIDAPEEGRVIWSQNCYPGWEVYLDNTKVKMNLYQDTFFAVDIPPGQHRIQYIFNPFSFKLGVGISLLTLLSGIVFALKTLQKNRSHRTAS